MAYQVVIAVLLVLIYNSESARILGVVPTPSYSHQVAFHPIWKELSLRGHQVVTITTDPINDPSLVNLTEIDLHSAYEIWNKYVMDMTLNNNINSFNTIINTFFEVTEYELSHHQVQNVIKNDTEGFDLVIVEGSLFSMFAFAERFNAPLISVLSFDAPIEYHSLMGNPIHGMLYPSVMFPFHYEMLFHERVMTVFFNLLSLLSGINYIINQNANVNKYFGSEYTPVEKLSNNISLLLINSDPIFYKVKPLVPTIVQFGGGTHKVAAKPLPKELKKILDAAENGFIYFSLGSNMKSKFLHEQTRSVIMETFSELPYTVLWKFEDDSLSNKPSNVITSKWVPQQDVLKHPNIKLFITQGGQQSMDEAVYDHVPILILPIFADQQANAYRMAVKGCAVTIDYKTMTKEQFKEAILEVINNPKYKNKMKELTELVLDQPMTGLEKAIWWIEYVIRHKGTAHLRSPYMDMPFYQYYYLDVITFFAGVFYILFKVFGIFVKLLKKMFRKVFYKDVKIKTT